MQLSPAFRPIGGVRGWLRRRSQSIADPSRAVDVAKGPITVDQVLASAAIPLGFPPGAIDAPDGAAAGTSTAACGSTHRYAPLSLALWRGPAHRGGWHEHRVRLAVATGPAGRSHADDGGCRGATHARHNGRPHGRGSANAAQPQQGCRAGRRRRDVVDEGRRGGDARHPVDDRQPGPRRIGRAGREVLAQQTRSLSGKVRESTVCCSIGCCAAWATDPGAASCSATCSSTASTSPRPSNSSLALLLPERPSPAAGNL